MASRVQYRDDHDAFVDIKEFVDDPVGESACPSPADGLPGMLSGIEERVFGDGSIGRLSLADKDVAQSWLPFFVPSGGGGNLLLDFGARADTPTHLPKRSRNRANISSAGTAESGSA